METLGNTRRTRNRSNFRGRGIRGRPRNMRVVEEEESDSGPATAVHSSDGNVTGGASSSSLGDVREDRDAVGQGDTHHTEVQPRRGEVDDDLQILWSRIGDTEARSESSDVVETPERNAENLRKRKSNTRDEEASEPAASSEMVPDACTICMEPLRDSGNHRICCLVCGHLFGLKCIERWLRDYGKKKCPQCQRKARKDEIRVLFAPRVVVADGRTAQESLELANENIKLKAENSRLKKNLQNAKKKLSSLEVKGQPSLERISTDDVRSAFGDSPSRREPPVGVDGRSFPTGVHFENLRSPENIAERWLRHNFQMSSNDTTFCELATIPVNGSKAFDMDASKPILVFSNRVDDSGSAYGFGLSKMNLLDISVIEKMNIQSDLGAIRDIRIAGSAHQGNLALVASIKKISLLSMENNSVVLSQDLSSPAWSCAWDPCDQNLFFAGLQNGSLLIFDIRQTASPITAWEGPEPSVPGTLRRPIHSLQVIPQGTNTFEPASAHSRGLLRGSQILGASVQGVFSWNANLATAVHSVSRATWIFTASEKFCSSVAYDKSTETAVTSLRPSPTLRLTPSILASRDGHPASSHALGHGSGDTAVFAEQVSSTPTRLDQFAGSPSTMCAPSEAALNRDSASHWMLRRLNVSGSTDSDPGTQASSSASASSHWKWVGEMTGHRSQSVLSRGVIIPRSNRSSVFASGDNLANNVSLWDMGSCGIFQSFRSHESAVVDVRHIQLQEIDLIGSLSERSLRLYQKMRE